MNGFHVTYVYEGHYSENSVNVESIQTTSWCLSPNNIVNLKRTIKVGRFDLDLKKKYIYIYIYICTHTHMIKIKIKNHIIVDGIVGFHE